MNIYFTSWLLLTPPGPWYISQKRNLYVVSVRFTIAKDQKGEKQKQKQKQEQKNRPLRLTPSPKQCTWSQPSNHPGVYLWPTSLSDQPLGNKWPAKESDVPGHIKWSSTCQSAGVEFGSDRCNFRCGVDEEWMGLRNKPFGVHSDCSAEHDVYRFWIGFESTFSRVDSGQDQDQGKQGCLCDWLLMVVMMESQHHGTLHRHLYNFSTLQPRQKASGGNCWIALRGVIYGGVVLAT